MVPHDLKDNKNFINDFPNGGTLFIKLPQGQCGLMKKAWPRESDKPEFKSFVWHGFLLT